MDYVTILWPELKLLYGCGVILFILGMPNIALIFLEILLSKESENQTSRALPFSAGVSFILCGIMFHVGAWMVSS